MSTLYSPTRLVFFDPIAGASGNMILGALLDAGLEKELLEHSLQKLLPGRWRLLAEDVRRGSLGATLVRVEVLEETPPHRHLPDILQIIEEAELPGGAAAQARAIFQRLAMSEARVHRMPIEDVHFHEVGAVDAIVDICAAAVSLDLLGVDRIYSGPLPMSSGTVSSAHGLLPLPAPATLNLLASAHAPTVPHNALVELVTPTGAAILTTLATFERPAMQIQAVGYGAGSRTVPEPNVLRVVLGATPGATPDLEERTLAVLECGIDDMNPQWYGHLFDRLLAEGALDVTTTAVLMKKGRPGQIVSVLCEPDHTDRLADVLLTETSTLGLRIHTVRRLAAARQTVPVETPFGPIAVKLRSGRGVITGATPEYEDCRHAALLHGVPLPVVENAARAAGASFVGRPADEVQRERDGGS
jgi:uncharacterized protein (TIGR00299 family) protein